MTIFACEVCRATKIDFCQCPPQHCKPHSNPTSYKELKEEVERRKKEAFKAKLKTISFKRVEGGGRD